MARSDLPAASSAAWPGLSGALPTLWASVRGWGKDERRGVFQTFNWTVLSAALCLQAGMGLVKLDVVWLALIALPATITGRVARRAGLSRAERPQFQRSGAGAAVSVRRRAGLEQCWPAAIAADVAAAWPPCDTLELLYARGQTRYLSMSRLHVLPSHLSREHLGLLLGFVGVAIFGGTLPATRIAVSAIDPLAMTSLRTAIAGLCSLALLIVLRRPLPPRRLWPQLAIAMLCVSILFPFLMALAVQTVDASHGGVVLGILPIATALVAVAITHERPKPLFWIASIAGAALVIALRCARAAARSRPAICCCSPRSPRSAIGYAFSGGSPPRCRDGKSSAGCW